MKPPSAKPWHKLGISRKEYLAGKPWKEYGMARDRFEKFILSLQQDVVADTALRKESGILQEKIFGRNRDR